MVAVSAWLEDPTGTRREFFVSDSVTDGFAELCSRGGDVYRVVEVHIIDLERAEVAGAVSILSFDAYINSKGSDS